jgi:hypothetical protein
MRRRRIVQTAPKRPNRSVEILPLDPRDPDIVRAKALEARAGRPRRRAA